ncbi:type 2 periplasmic-binding domain-containing protein [Mycoplasma suis]|uniref:Spermidine/putrescine import binding protein n=2 Tax=Mycoplasma suis TaxID=57372 RepID=F0QQ54_MYCSL|nr:spermidine/putrescine ABC transporter substrate-binding protein [Mycoplasma suis]ADX97624.1 spermidine/putrescine import binding protein [Mycoplasma suis str. Illinois]CBZ40159.1 ABC-type spermidine/putrescine-binding periplasmic transport protein PotD [Mycoplasma suis KI3806]
MGLKLLTVPILGTFVLPISIVNLNFQSGDIVLATYQSYISDDIATEASSSYGVQTVYFENDRDILNGFRTGAYDLAIMSSSTLEEAIKKNIVKQIQWDKLPTVKDLLKVEDGNGSSHQTSGSGNTNNQNTRNWEKVFSPIVTQFFKQKPELAQYGLPYFLSYLLFAYRCQNCDKEIKTQENLSWQEKFKKIIEHEEFKNNNPFKLGIIEDEVTILSLSKLASQENNKFNEQNWKVEENKPFNFFDKYKDLSKLGVSSRTRGNSMFLNSDSALMSEMLTKKQLDGVFMYNGDALYSYQEIRNEKEGGEVQDFKILEPTPSLWLLDQIAISSKVSESKENEIYKFLDKLLFEGAIKKTQSDQAQGQQSQNSEAQEKSWAWQNFDYLGYTPTLKDMQETIKSKHEEFKKKKEKSEQQTQSSEKSEDEKEYDDLTIQLLFGRQNEDQCKKPVSNGQPQTTENQQSENTKCKILFESGMTDNQNLDLALAFQRWKNNWF